jgi:iron(III) transport system substrate-binding protein
MPAGGTVSRIRPAVTRRRLIKRGTAGLAVLLLAGGLAACGSASGASGSAGSITLYSGQHEQTTQSLVTAFEQQTGIRVNVRYNDEDSFADEINAEKSHPVADVFYTENSPVLEYLQNQGLLAPVDGSTLAKTPSAYNSPQGDWVGVSARVSVLIYNPSMIKESQLPTSVLQLANPKYKGELAFAAGETDFQPIVTSVARKYGDAAALTWLEALKANATSHLYPDNETITSEVNSGQVALGIINQYYWYRLRADVGAPGMHSKIAYFAPHDVGYVVDVSGAGILKSSPHQADDQKFVAFLNSAQGQKILAQSQSFEYPIASGVTRTGETPFNKLQPNSISIAQLGTGAEAIKLLQEAQLL